MNFLEAVGFLVVFLLGSGTGLWLGFALGREQGQAEREHLLALLSDVSPGHRKAGTPTNMDGPPARQSTGKYRQRRRWDLQG